MRSPGALPLWEALRSRRRRVRRTINSSLRGAPRRYVSHEQLGEKSCEQMTPDEMSEYRRGRAYNRHCSYLTPASDIVAGAVSSIQTNGLVLIRLVRMTFRPE